MKPTQQMLYTYTYNLSVLKEIVLETAAIYLSLQKLPQTKWAVKQIVQNSQ